MNIENVILGRRSIRKFIDEKIEKEKIDKILEAGIWAPTGGNVQARVFIAVTDPAKLTAIRNYSPGIMGKPPLIVVLGTDLTKAQRSGATDWQISAIMDNAMAAENMMLLAYEMGIGSCAVLSFDKNMVERELSVPNTVTIDLLVTFGKPAYIGKAPARSKDLIFFDLFGEKYEGNVVESVEMETKKYETFEKEHVLDLITYIIYGAKSLSKEPKEYSIFRLLEVAGRLLDNYPDIEKNEKLRKVKDKLDKLRFGEMISKEETEKEVEELSKLL